MPSTRRHFLTRVSSATAVAASPASAAASAPGPGVTKESLEKAAAQPTLRRELFPDPVIVESIRLLRWRNEHVVHVRARNGAEGIGFPQPGRPALFAPIFQETVAPFFIGKDIRDLDNLLWELYRWRSNYKLYGLAFWSAQAWAEFAILDLLGRVAGKPIGELFGPVRRKEIPVYVASERRDTTPEQEIEYLQSLIAKSGAKAVKFRLGGRMSRNADASPGRSEKLIRLAGKTFGGKYDLHGDSNSSWDPPLAIQYGRMLEVIGAIYLEEPCPFDHLEDTKVVADALTIPVAGGEQEYSEWRFRWMIQNRGVDIVQPDLHYYGGLIRSLRVARMADLANMPTTVHISGGFGFVYMLHFASIVKDPGKYQEYKLGTEKYGPLFDDQIQVKEGRMSVPVAPGVGIRDLRAVLTETRDL